LRVVSSAPAPPSTPTSPMNFRKKLSHSKTVDPSTVSMIKLWAVIEDGMLKYFKSIPTYTTRPLGYVNLLAAAVSPTTTQTTYQSTPLTVVTITEKATDPFQLAFKDEHTAQQWIATATVAAKGKRHPPQFMGHNAPPRKSEGGSGASAQQFPTKSGPMQKKAIGKKKILYRTTKARYFKLLSGELRYYKDESYKSSTLKGTVVLSTCPGKATVTNGTTLTIPLPNGLALTCVCKEEGEALDWQAQVNVSIDLCQSNRKRASTAGKSQKRKVIVDKSGTSEHSQGSASTPKVALRKWEKSEHTIGVLTGALKSHFLFETAPDFNMVLAALQPLDCQAGDTVIWQGDEGDKFYILESGVCEVVKDGNVLAFQQKEGTAFGELALINGEPRAASIRAKEMCKLWYMDRSTFRNTLNEMENGMVNQQVEFLNQISLFEDLSKGVLTRIAEAMKLVTYKHGERIITQGDNGEEFFMIRKGEVVVTQKREKGVEGEKVLTRYGPGDYFGELALMKDEPRKANVSAINEVECFSLDRANFNETLGPLQDVLDMHRGIALMRKVKLLADNLTETEMEKVGRKLQRKVVKDGERIIKQGDKGDNFYMIERGTVQILIDNSEVGSLSESSATPYFGEMAIMKDDVRVATVVADGSVQVMFLTRSDFVSTLGHLKDIIEREADKRAQSNNVLVNTLGRIGRAFSRTSSVGGSGGGRGRKSTVQGIPYSALVEKRVLGCGTFGTVKLMQDGRDGKGYAMKILRKTTIVQMRQEGNVYREREMMELLIHPLVLRLYECYQDANALYMLLELVPGGELWVLLHGDEQVLKKTSLGGVTLETAKFYAANVLAALEFMHKQGVAYRDLKPENLVVDGEGYLRVIDLGFAKHIGEGGKTNTLCGTPEYLAPELVLSKGHGTPVDIWALGILIFELLTSNTPFADDDATVMFQKISNPVIFLKKAMKISLDKKSKALVLKLLELKPIMRLGCKKGGMEELWDNSWFDGLTSDLIERKALRAPYVPNVEGAEVLNFEEVDDEHGDVESFSYNGSQDTWRKWGNKVK